MNALKRLVITWLATARGGAEKSSLELCQTLRQRYQVEVVLVLWHYGARFDFGAAAPADAVRNCYDAAQYRRQLTAALAVAPTATVLFSNHRTYQIDLGLAARLGVKSGVIFRESPLLDEALRTLPSPAASQLVFRRGGELDWPLLDRAAALVGVSSFGTRQLAHFAPQHPQLVRIYNGLRVPDAIINITPRPVRRFLIVSRLIGWKAIEFGITAFAALRRRYPTVHLQIAGEGDELPRLQNLVAQLGLAAHVEFLGFQQDISRVYQANDCLLHVSTIESFGRVIVEANWSGLPAIVPQCAGTGELVINDHTGLTFQPRDLADCVRALEQAYHLDAAAYIRLAQTAQRRAQALFNLDRAVEDYLGLANTILLG